MRNIEIKAKICNVQSLKMKVELLCGNKPERLSQEDIYFDVKGKRKKLRVFTQTYGELIEYSREDKLGPKLSQYSICKTDNPESVFQKLSQTHRIKKIVRKNREVYMLNRARIHLDSVEKLGDFIELEVVLKSSESEEDGVMEARNILKALNLEKIEFIEGSYEDLLDNSSLYDSTPSFYR